MMFLSTVLGTTNFNLLQILTELAIIGYLLYKNILHGLKRIDIFIFIILLITHLISLFFNPIMVALLNFKLALLFILWILY